MLAPEHAAPEFALPEFDARALLRRLAVPALLTAFAVAFVLLAGGRIHAFADAMRRGLDVSPSWAAMAGVFEFVSLAGYVGLLSLIAGRATPRVGARESAQITLAGAAATRLLPTAGAGGVALALWALRRAGLESRAATRTLLVFLIVLYSVFLGSIVVAGGMLALGLVHSDGPTELAAVPAVIAALGIGLCLGLASRPRAESAGSRPKAGAQLVGDAVSEACGLVRQRDPRLAGAIVYWAFDAAVLWAMLHAFGSAPMPPAGLGHGLI